MNAVVPIRQPVADYTGQQLVLIKRTVAKDTNDDEFNLFMSVARMKGLDPFTKQISCIVFNKDKADKRQMAIITGIDGMRAIAARSGRYRPDEDEPVIEYDPSLKAPTNPLGIVKAVVRIYIADASRDGGWKPVAGVAYWDEFAPIKDEWAYDDAERKRKPTGKQTLDGNWPKMPRVMISKCAESQALRKAFPEDLSGIYEDAELDRAAMIDVTPSDIIDQAMTTDRLNRIGAGGHTITLQMFPNAPLERIPLGQVGDKVAEAIEGIENAKMLDWFEDANRHPLQEFWGWAPGDALELKKRIAAKRQAITKKADA